MVINKKQQKEIKEKLNIVRKEEIAKLKEEIALLIIINEEKRKEIITVREMNICIGKRNSILGKEIKVYETNHFLLHFIKCMEKNKRKPNKRNGIIKSVYMENVILKNLEEENTALKLALLLK